MTDTRQRAAEAHRTGSILGAMDSLNPHPPHRPHHGVMHELRLILLGAAISVPGSIIAGLVVEWIVHRCGW